MEKLFKMKKGILSCLGIIILFILMGNSNNVPESFVERIFAPIRGDSWRFSYAGFIIIVGLYYCLKSFNEIRENFLISTSFRRIIITIVLMNIFSAVWVHCIQIYKGFSNDLNSIYLDRENTSVEFYGDKDKLIVKGLMHIVNCSNNAQKFQIKVKAPFLVKEDISKEYITLTNEFTVPQNKEKTLNVNEVIKFDKESQYSGYSSKAFEYILFNEKGESLFKGKLDEYQMGELN
ncbi:hypothetical protein CDLVIII_3398 [Clostridium sp. DL-VIII]|uniref:hypothetical protein n=1 Tax=Clostridium sp. DL-VIII TaxID=641107 RepID=UPI00023AF956|nr:hypothetical protein [Clostridium sp. DL-VIII]EHI99960.1 hypothetical protein CDLVIII_3398 [Clostridium sp. DL-VIII]